MPMTKAQLSRQASFIAKNASDWAADLLWDDEQPAKLAGDLTVERFVGVIRDRLDIIEQMHKEDH